MELGVLLGLRYVFHFEYPDHSSTWIGGIDDFEGHPEEAPRVLPPQPASCFPLRAGWRLSCSNVLARAPARQSERSSRSTFTQLIDGAFRLQGLLVARRRPDDYFSGALVDQVQGCRFRTQDGSGGIHYQLQGPVKVASGHQTGHKRFELPDPAFVALLPLLGDPNQARSLIRQAYQGRLVFAGEGPTCRLADRNYADGAPILAKGSPDDRAGGWCVREGKRLPSDGRPRPNRSSVQCRARARPPPRA